ncbi:MAG: hypothetical protein BWK79_10635 [Beggiatoa sp. IS2]|nr:MAG: hypothetical protein BWK79_10635 [Beggiatoa sp. IS2]
METPFDILEVSENASDEIIKKAYLHKVRQCPPERDPKQFQRIRQAFETVQTQQLRLRYQLFHHEPPRFATLIVRSLQTTALPQRLSVELFVQTLAESLNRHRDQ